MVDRMEPDGRVQARTYAQADDIDGITYVRPGAGNSGRGIQAGDVIEVTIDTVVNDYDFETTLVRQVNRAPSTRSSIKLRALPVMSTVGAFGR
jgi:hypothetical protein